MLNRSMWRDNLERIIREANALGADKCGPAPHACPACEIRYLAEQLLMSVAVASQEADKLRSAAPALLAACDLTAKAIREAMQAGDDDDARLSMAYARLVVNEMDSAIARTR